MMKDEILEKILMHPNMREFCIYQQTEIINMLDDVFHEIRKEKPYATLSEFLSKSDV